MRATDALSVAALSEQLGYPTDQAQVRRRFIAIEDDERHGLFVAVAQDGLTIGWVHVYDVPLLETDGYAEIGGLVVHSQARRQGVGRALMQAAEQWAQDRSHRDLRLGSGLHRTEAHAFYANLGYTLMKAGHRFHKSLDEIAV